MSISEQITRLTNAKADISSAISAKGVSVPDGTTLDGMSALIDQIRDDAVLYTAQTLTEAEQTQARDNIGAVAKAGGTMTGALVAQNNTDYAVAQTRNIFLVAEGADLPTGGNGDICFVYTP